MKSTVFTIGDAYLIRFDALIASGHSVEAADKLANETLESSWFMTNPAVVRARQAILNYPSNMIEQVFNVSDDKKLFTTYLSFVLRGIGFEASFSPLVNTKYIYVKTREGKYENEINALYSEETALQFYQQLIRAGYMVSDISMFDKES